MVYSDSHTSTRIKRFAHSGVRAASKSKCSRQMPIQNNTAYMSPLMQQAFPQLYIRSSFTWFQVDLYSILQLAGICTWLLITSVEACCMWLRSISHGCANCGSPLPLPMPWLQNSVVRVLWRDGCTIMDLRLSYWKHYLADLQYLCILEAQRCQHAEGCVRVSARIRLKSK